ncbi:TraK family protein [Desulfovibrio sp. JC022]|uniref:TraK family protein n=1 Tax=Desulfovibrio sp. JC022 TaxID=2593642 RepID=UPI0013CFACFE|nr:TraK family protein [Desulfovibrio sp. JC022]NDV23853.1 hypothetical protein [Desulfovibrio sp. JC022]
MKKTNQKISAPTGKKAKHARVQYKVNLQKITDLINEGYTKKAIYELLHKEGLISMSYSHFCRFNSEGSLGPKKMKKRKRTSKLPTKDPNQDFDHQKIVTDEEFKKMTG